MHMHRTYAEYYVYICKYVLFVNGFSCTVRERVCVMFRSFVRAQFVNGP